MGTMLSRAIQGLLDPLALLTIVGCLVMIAIAVVVITDDGDIGGTNPGA